MLLYSSNAGTHYYTARNSNGQWWNGATYENYNVANWSTYAFSSSTGNNGWFTGSTLARGATYDLRLRAGGSPASTDVVVTTYVTAVLSPGVDQAIGSLAIEGGTLFSDDVDAQAIVRIASLEVAGYPVKVTNDGTNSFFNVLSDTGQPLGAGSGSYPIDHNGGQGLASEYISVDGVQLNSGTATDSLRYTTDGSTGVTLTIRAYLKSSYDTTTGTGYSGTTQTGSDGRWLAPLMLNSGTYYLIADNPGDGYQASQITIVVP